MLAVLLFQTGSPFFGALFKGVVTWHSSDMPLILKGGSLVKCAVPNSPNDVFQLL